MRATRLLLVTAAEPAALTDAYALIKIVSLQVRGLPIDVVVNRTREDAEGRAAYERLAAAAERFLKRGLKYLGAVPEDPAMRDAIEFPASLLASEGPAAMRALRAIATSRIDLPPVLRLVTADSPGEVQ